VNTKDGFRTHTQTIEGNNCAVKKAIPVHKRSGEDLQDRLFEFMWRRNNAGNLWAALLKGLATVRYGVPELHRIDEVDEPWEPTDILIEQENMVDYDSAATEDTDTDDDIVREEVRSGDGGGGGAVGAARGRASLPRRQQQKWRGQPVVEAILPAVFRRQDEAAALDQATLEAILGSGSTEDEKDGVTAII